ncbi:MAG: DUF4919 domain-containing protein [Propionibacterium sp.]|nr:DUF4919 domain-containing protein [Propionibacterium sp.]
MPARVNEALRAHLDRDTPESLALLQGTIRSEPTFDASCPWHERATFLLQSDRHDEVIRLINAYMPGAFLSPDAHLMLSHAHEQIRDVDRSRLEAYRATTALRVVVDSGSGTRERPWQVLRVIDEYATLRHLRVVPAAQRLVIDGGREFDVHACEDGVERWFELV